MFSEFLTEQNAYDSALEFATQKHLGQERKFSGEAYINHPIAVADVLKHYTNDIRLIQAGLLHDTLEDTKTTYNELIDNFGKEVADIVVELTSPSNMDKSQKRFILTDKMNKMSDGALTVKLADRLNNVSDFDTAPKHFIKKYKPETEYILDNLDRNLSPIQQKLVDQIRLKINI